MKNQELSKKNGVQINTSIGLDLIYSGRIQYLSELKYQKKSELLRYFIDKEGRSEDIDWEPIDEATRKKYNSLEAKKK